MYEDTTPTRVVQASSQNDEPNTQEQNFNDQTMVSMQAPSTRLRVNLAAVIAAAFGTGVILITIAALLLAARGEPRDLEFAEFLLGIPFQTLLNAAIVVGVFATLRSRVNKDAQRHKQDRR
jgi:hypothetical protein